MKQKTKNRWETWSVILAAIAMILMGWALSSCVQSRVFQATDSGAVHLYSGEHLPVIHDYDSGEIFQLTKSGPKDYRGPIPRGHDSEFLKLDIIKKNY